MYSLSLAVSFQASPASSAEVCIGLSAIARSAACCTSAELVVSRLRRPMLRAEAEDRRSVAAVGIFMVKVSLWVWL